MAKLRAVTIAHTGKGNAGHRLHRSFSELNDVVMVGLSDPDPEGRQKLGSECRAERLYADYREMLQREKPDIAIVGRAFYDDERVDQFIAACESGVKGIYIEKPVNSWPDQAARMVAAARAHDVKVAVAHRSREHPTMQAIKRRADAGEWGELIHVRTQGKGDRRTGPMDALVLGTHVFDAAIFVIGVSPVACSGTVLAKGKPATRGDATEVPTYGIGTLAGDRLTATYLFPNGVVATYDSLPVGDGTYGTEHLGADFYFRNSVVTTRGLPLGEFHVFPQGDIFPQSDLGSWTPIPVEDWVAAPSPIDRASPAWHAYGEATMTLSNQRIGAGLVEWIQTGKAPLGVSTIDDGVVCLEMIVGAQRSHLEGRWLSLPLENKANPWVE